MLSDVVQYLFRNYLNTVLVDHFTNFFKFVKFLELDFCCDWCVPNSYYLLPTILQTSQKY